MGREKERRERNTDGWDEMDEGGPGGGRPTPSLSFPPLLFLPFSSLLDTSVFVQNERSSPHINCSHKSGWGHCYSRSVSPPISLPSMITLFLSFFHFSIPSPLSSSSVILPDLYREYLTPHLFLPLLYPSYPFFPPSRSLPALVPGSLFSCYGLSGL